MPLTGSCLCGAITVSVDIDLSEAKGTICACKSCHKLTSGCSNNVGVPASAVKVTAGTPKSYDYVDTGSGHPADYQFCGNCSCPLWALPTAPGLKGLAFVKLGLLDDAKDIKAENILFPEKLLPGLDNIGALPPA